VPAQPAASRNTQEVKSQPVAVLLKKVFQSVGPAEEVVPVVVEYVRDTVVGEGAVKEGHTAAVAAINQVLMNADVPALVEHKTHPVYEYVEDPARSIVIPQGLLPAI
jgi:hypothetical protein